MKGMVESSALASSASASASSPIAEEAAVAAALESDSDFILTTISALGVDAAVILDALNILVNSIIGEEEEEETDEEMGADVVETTATATTTTKRSVDESASSSSQQQQLSTLMRQMQHQWPHLDPRQMQAVEAVLSVSSSLSLDQVETLMTQLQAIVQPNAKFIRLFVVNVLQVKVMYESGVPQKKHFIVPLRSIELLIISYI